MVLYRRKEVKDPFSEAIRKVKVDKKGFTVCEAEGCLNFVTGNHIFCEKHRIGGI